MSQAACNVRTGPIPSANYTSELPYILTHCILTCPPYDIHTCTFLHTLISAHEVALYTKQSTSAMAGAFPFPLVAVAL